MIRFVFCREPLTDEDTCRSGDKRKLEEPAGDQIGADDMHPARTSAADGELEQAFSAVLDQIADVLKGRKQISASLNWTDCSQDSMRITYQVRFLMSDFP